MDLKYEFQEYRMVIYIHYKIITMIRLVVICHHTKVVTILLTIFLMLYYIPITYFITGRLYLNLP